MITEPTSPSAAPLDPSGTLGANIPPIIYENFGLANTIFVPNVKAITTMLTAKNNSSFLTPK